MKVIMKTFNNCSICNEINCVENNDQDEEYREIISNKRNILYKALNFTVIPSLGPLNPFHLLIVTNNCVTSFASLNDECTEEYMQIKYSIQSYNQIYYDMDTIVFEHGSGECVNRGGASISHAHMHIIAIPKKLDISNLLSSLNLSPLNGMINKPILLQKGYLYLQDTNNKSFINYTRTYQSQILRKYIISLLGEPEKWDWRIFKNYDYVYMVINNYLNLHHYINSDI